ncbi:response regulator [Uliginosibacterium sp. H3]|uniref:histidine kinase n=1 Tax=Uliginosibacterium silvisoli TaxID=3114758 RepID=A0ABU6JZ61_9RHOO|nr:response regulator [Uliginosibacterium sp. H3]
MSDQEIQPISTGSAGSPAPEQAAPLAPEVLVVDDNPVTRYSTSRVLRAAGYRTRDASTGQDALDKADGTIAGVILDVHLPDMSGFEVCRLLREQYHTARLPIIHLSAAYVGNQDKVRGLDSGADAYMTHPADPALLVATLHALVRARTAEESMRRSEARFRAIYDQALNGICLIDTAGTFIEANPAMLALLKRDQYGVVGKRIVDFAPPEWVTRITGYLEESQQGNWGGEFPLQDATGNPVYLEWSLSAHVEPGLNMAIASDISERMALSRQREDLLEREQAARASAERVSRSKDEFVAVLSHELRTPLNAILSWVHVLKQPAATSSLERGLDAIERNAKTQTRLISDILDVSRMDLGKLSLDLETVDAAELVTSAVSALSGSAQIKELDVVVDVAGVARPVIVDAARLQQIVWNLLTNAIKFSSRGGHIYVSLIQEEGGKNDGGLTLTVQDEGQGIKPDFLPHLFDRFTQSDSSSNRYHGGLGLGLSIVKQLVELHGGQVTALSAGIGQGATFVVTIPARHASRASPSPVILADAELNDKDILHAALAGLSIVVVDDDAEAREMLGVILRDRGALVTEAGDYAEGLRCIGQHGPDVLVSDIGMPGKDGYALIRELRRREALAGTHHLPAIALTAFARPEDQKVAISAGFDAHCAKPMRPNVLISTILELSRAAS